MGWRCLPLSSMLSDKRCRWRIRGWHGPLHANRESCVWCLAGTPQKGYVDNSSTLVPARPRERKEHRRQRSRPKHACQSVAFMRGGRA